MAKLIDREELYNKVYQLACDCAGVIDGICSDYANGLATAAHMIEEAPAVDAVPVVRCKDCKYWQDNNGGYPHGECRWSCEETPESDDFCSWAERKDEAK